MPAMRTVFSIFYLIPLFNIILNLAKNNGYQHSYVSVFLFVGFLIANLLALLPTQFSLAAIISFVFLIPLFKALNFAAERSIFRDLFRMRLFILFILSALGK
jgi:hypothetical protein